MFEYKRLHPITVLTNFFGELKDLFIPFIFLFFIGSRGGGSAFWLKVKGFILLFLLLAIIVSGVIKWLRFTYRLEDGELRIEYGLFVKKKRYIPFDRIQSLDFTEGVIQRPFGLVKVKIETASGEDAELTAIKKADAFMIQETIKTAKRQLKQKAIQETEAADLEVTKETFLLRLSNKDLLLMASTSGGIGVVISAAVAFILQFEDYIPYEKIFNELEGFVRNGVLFIITAIFATVLLAWFISILITLLKYNQFTIKVLDQDLIITRGLLEKHQTTIPLHRIQAIKMVENPFRQLVGYVTVYIHSAGGSALDKEEGKITLLPIFKKANIPDVLGHILPEYVFDLSLQRAPKRAKRRFMMKNMIFSAIVTIILSIFIWPYGLLGAFLFLYSFLIGIARYKAAGWNIQNQQLTLQYRQYLKYTIYFQKNRIQSLEERASWFQKRAHLATISATAKSGFLTAEGIVPHLCEQDINNIYQWYRPHKTVSSEHIEHECMSSMDNPLT